MIDRSAIAAQIRASIRRNPVTVLTGPRQCGKTTIAREIARTGRSAYFDLEDPVSLARLNQPMEILGPMRGLAVIDEVQLRPDLYPMLRVLADRKPLPLRFLLLGSASPELIQKSSETLAGRAGFLEMGGFRIGEIPPGKSRRLWWRGGFPRAFLARTDADCRRWQEDFIRTFLERDLFQLGSQIPSITLRRFWNMLAHYHGQVWNGSGVGGSLGLAHTTVKRHLDLLTGGLVIRQLPPWHENMGKRQVKSPKIYVRDTGLLHALLGMHSMAALEGHPKLGASWEGFVVEQILTLVGERNAWFWATQAGAELDLLLILKGKRYGVEVKFADAPSMTRSMHSSLHDLKLERLWVVYPGSQRYALGDRAEVVSLSGLDAELQKFR